MGRTGLLLVVAAAALLVGCVDRRIYVRTEPPGAEVYIDGEYVGTTRAKDDPQGPLYANFVYYGTREFTLRKPGYATVSGAVRLETPWYQYPPMDFVAEVLTPWRIVDRHHIEATLDLADHADVDSLYAAAQEFRYQSRPQDRFEFAIMKARRPIEPRRP
jgi:hypothetical protein